MERVVVVWVCQYNRDMSDKWSRATYDCFFFFFLLETKKNKLIKEKIQEKEKIQKKEKKPREG